MCDCGEKSGIPKCNFFRTSLYLYLNEFPISFLITQSTPWSSTKRRYTSRPSNSISPMSLYSMHLPNHAKCLNEIPISRSISEGQHYQLTVPLVEGHCFAISVVVSQKQIGCFAICRTITAMPFFATVTPCCVVRESSFLRNSSFANRTSVIMVNNRFLILV